MMEVELPNTVPTEENNVVDTAGGDGGLQPPSDKKALPRLSTTLNLFCFWLFSIFNNAGYYIALGIGLLKYLSWGLSIIDVVKAGMIIYTLQTLTQVVVAIYSDRTMTRFGRRKPFVIAGNLVRYVSVFLLCSPPDFGDRTDYLFAWYVVFNTLSWMGYTIHLNPYQSWMIESTVDDADYVKIRAVALPFGGLIGGVSAAVMLVFSPLLAASYYVIGGIISLICIISIVPSVCYREQKKQPHIIPSVRMCAQYGEFLQVFWNRVFMEAASITYVALIYFMCATSFHMNNESSIIAVFLLCAIVGGIGGVVFSMLCNWILQFYDRLHVLRTLQLTVATLSCLTFFISMSDSSVLFAIYVVLCILIAVTAVPLIIICEILMRDLVVFDTFVTGYNRENMYISALFIPSSILSQFISAIPVVVVTLTGFKSTQESGQDDDSIDSSYTWTEGSVWAFRVFSSFFIMSLCLAAYVVMYHFSITKAVTVQVNRIVKEREKKRESIYTADTPGSQYQPAPESKTEPSSSSRTADTTDSALPLLPLPSQASIDAVNDHQRQLLLHLSLPELYRIHSSVDFCEQPAADPEAGSSNAGPHMVASLRGLTHITTHVTCGVLISFCTMVLYIVALIFDSHQLDGTFSTLLIYILLLVFFYFLYEVFRLVALMELAGWSVSTLHDFAKLTYAEFSASLADVHSLLAKEQHLLRDIDIHHQDDTNSYSEVLQPPNQTIAEDKEQSPEEERVSLVSHETTDSQHHFSEEPEVDSNKLVFEIDKEMEHIAQQSTFLEDHVAEDAFDSLAGYRYVYLAFVAIVGFAIFVISYALV